METIARSSSSTEISVTAANRFVIGSFFQITWLLVKKNWTHSHNFKSIVELVAAYSGEEIKKHLLYAPQNANHVSPEYIFKCIQIMDDHIKLPLLASLRSSDPFLFFIDGTSDVTMTKQMTISATFNYQGTFREHYVGTIPIS